MPTSDEAATAVQKEQHVQVTGTFRLVVVDGPDRGAELVLDGTQSNRVLVGQGTSCDLKLTDPTVSRRHVAFDLGESGLRLVDLQSRNGTFVSGVRVFDALLEGGEMVRLGKSMLRIDAVGAAHAVPVSAATSFGHTVGSSLEMRRLYPLCERLAGTDVPVVIEGDTGTGKEVLAESIHDTSARATGPFVVFDCTAVPPNLVESELFGHERGAFTGAVAQRIGVFEQAHGGTLLIDEIGDLDLSLQPKLLRVIQRSEVRRVGGSETIKVDVRVLAATRRDLDREVQDGRFRDDLYYRLAVARIELPPLSARKGDIAVLATHFWAEMGGKDEPPYDLLRRFERYAWPGNVRELANAVARHIALGDFAPAGDALTAVPPGADVVESVLGLELPFPRARDRVVAEFERRYVERMLARHGGNVTQAAQASGIGRRYFAMIASRHGK